MRKNVPAELQALPAWVAASREPKKDRTGQIRSSKAPINPRTGTKAKSNDPSTWGTFGEAINHALGDDRCFGIGVNLLGSDYLGLDLDHVIDPDTGQLLCAANDLLGALPETYTEGSPSGTGLRLFYRGRKPAGLRGSVLRNAFGPGTQLEVYDGDGGARYLTVTGRAWGAPVAVAEANDEQLAPLLELLPRQANKAGQTTSTSRCAWDAASDLARAQYGLLEAKILDPDSGYDGWFRVGAALHGLGDDGLNLWDVWSQSSKCYDGDEIRKKWPGLTRSTIASLFWMFDAASPGWRQRFRKAHIQRHPPNPRIPGDSEEDDALSPAGMETTLGRRDDHGRLILSPKRTLPTAEAYVREYHSHHDGVTLVSYAGQLLAWRGNRYSAVEDEWMMQRLHPWLHASWYWRKTRNGDMELVPFEANPGTVNAALSTIRSTLHLPATTTPPCWLREGGEERRPASEILPCLNSSLHIPSMTLLKPTPQLFTINALDFDFDPAAPAPARWLAFLNELLGVDTESAHLLQEWFGYCLVADTRQQKMLLLVGPRRSGKGTIGRIITRVVGSGNVAGPTIGGLAGNFGLQPLLGKSLAVVSDARFTGDGLPIVVERLLCISGEDMLTVDRKFQTSVTMKLQTRFMFLTNELPRFNDASTALAGRFLVLQLTKSFYGREDVHLVDELLGELPGILLWAVEGWRRLHDRGHFREPAASREAIQDIEDLSSPVSAFVRDQCIVAPGHRTNCADLYRAWCNWCSADGRSTHTTAQVFGRDLAAAASGVARRRCTGRPPFYEGIGLAGGNA